MESSLTLLIKDKLNVLTFLALPKRAIHAMILLHNRFPEDRTYYSSQVDIPRHRLLDYLKGVVNTNAFSHEVLADGTEVGHIVLTDGITLIADVKEGEELMVSYGQTAEIIEQYYGIKASLPSFLHAVSSFDLQ
ncbi:hypothetical protein DFH09DRAFT_1362035 [Mycena vulgaris]|nr:hypothetical protein DFH09DRAFT_1362035 [Mycena vulgaris]